MLVQAPYELDDRHRLAPGTPRAWRSALHEDKIVYPFLEGFLFKSIRLKQPWQTQRELQDYVFRHVFGCSAEFLHKLISYRKPNIVLQGGSEQALGGFRVGSIPCQIKIYVEVECKERHFASASPSNTKIHFMLGIRRSCKKGFRFKVSNMEDNLSSARRSTPLRPNPFKSDATSALIVMNPSCSSSVTRLRMSADPIPCRR